MADEPPAESIVHVETRPWWRRARGSLELCRGAAPPRWILPAARPAGPGRPQRTSPHRAAGTGRPAGSRLVRPPV